MRVVVLLFRGVVFNTCRENTDVVVKVVARHAQEPKPYEEEKKGTRGSGSGHVANNVWAFAFLRFGWGLD